VIRAALLSLALSGCAICRVPAPEPASADVEQGAFLDANLAMPAVPVRLTGECLTIDLRPGADVVLRLLVDMLRLSLQAAGRLE
jgi:hypothetical protein